MAATLNHAARIGVGTARPHKLRYACLVWLLLVAGVSSAHAEMLRVTTWNLGIVPETEDSAAVINKAATVLRDLKPDVIILQQVQNWQMCEKLTQALKPYDYNVLVCSAFRGPSPSAANLPQCAILSKGLAYFSWSYTWQSAKQQTSGAVFAAIQARTQRVGFFSTLLGDQSGTDTAKPLLDELNLVSHWETNDVQTFVIGASTGPGSRNPSKAIRRVSSVFEHAELVNGSEPLPSELKPTIHVPQGSAGIIGDCLFAGPNGFPGVPRITRSMVSQHYPITCDIELDPGRVANALDIRAERHRQHKREIWLNVTRIMYWAGGALGFAVIIVGVAKLLRRKPRKVAPQRRHLPARIPPKGSQPAVKPIIFAQRPPAANTPMPQTQTPFQGRRPALRLQKPIEPRLPPETPPAKRADSEEQEKNEPGPPEGPPPPDNTTAVSTTSLREDDEVRHGVIHELSIWLKHKLVRKLVSDRQQLMEAQQLATRMATTLDNRLSRIEAQINQQNQAYIRRIEELNRELEAAREENRELIRERIAAVKAEMEAARVKVLADADLDDTSLRL